MLCCVFFSLVRDVFIVAKKTKKTNYYNKKTIDGTTAKCVSDDGWLSHAGLFQNKSKNFAIVRQITILYMRIAHYDRPGLFYCCVICKCDRAPFNRLVHQRTITTTIALMLRARTTTNTTANKYDVRTHKTGPPCGTWFSFFFLETSSVKKIKKKKIK